MGLIDSMKKAIKGTSDWLRGTPPTERTTTASRRAAEQVRYAHVSKEIPEEATLAMQMGLPLVAEALTRRAPGQTYYSPVAAVKREADKLASRMGFNNKMRRRLRGHMVKRYREVHA